MAEQARYSAIAVALHWAIALLIIGQIAGGFYMHNLPNASPVKYDLYQLHKSFGLSILVLTVFRLGWRLGHKVPPLPSATPPWQRFGARAAHWGFYALMLLIPLSGWAMVSVSPLDIPTVWFGMIPVPHLPFFGGVADRAGAEEFLIEVHELLAFAMIGLLVLHVGAALKHRLVDRDEVLQSMAPSRSAEWIGAAGIIAALCVGAVVYAVAPSAPASAAPEAGALPPAAASTPSAGPAGANWTVDYGASRLGFSGSEKGNAFEGTFGDFAATISFDPDNLETASIVVDVSTASGSTGDQIRDETMPGAEWFNTGAYPSARFVSQNVRRTGEGAYEAQGALTIKDFTQGVVLPFTLDIDGDAARAAGGVDLIRTDFGLGEKSSWLDEEGVALEVRVDFEIVAARAN